MKAELCQRINWDELLERIEDKNVIPVIGHGIYQVQTISPRKSVMLYDYLAEKLAAEVGFSFEEGEIHKFSNAV